MAELLILAAVGLGTYALRAVFLVTARPEPPAPLARLLPYVGPAVLAAITVPALLAPRGTISVTDTVPAVLAAGAAWLLWRWTRSLPIALFGALGAAFAIAWVIS